MGRRVESVVNRGVGDVGRRVGQPGRTRRATLGRLGLAAALVLGGAVWPLTGAQAAAACWDVPVDLDGGGPDVAIGLPSYDLVGKPDAGAVAVFSNVGTLGEADPKAPTKRTLLTADDFPGLSSQAGARFGASVVVWRDAGTRVDNCADLVIGVPGQNVAGKTGAGQIVRVHGSPSGISGVGWVLDEASLAGTGGAQAGAGFGSTIAVDSGSALAVGVPRRNLGTATDAGQIVLLNYLESETPDVSVIRQGAPGAGKPETGDRFGEVMMLSATGAGPLLVIGVPHEDVGSKVDAGAVALRDPHGELSMVGQDSAGAAGVAESGDRYGASLSIFYTFTTHPVGIVPVGIPGEDLGSDTNAGAVDFARFDFGEELTDPMTPIFGLPKGLTQDSPGVPGNSEDGDAFGSSLVTGEIGRESGLPDLAVGAPGEALGSVRQAGMLEQVRIKPDGTTDPSGGAPVWHQDLPSVPGVAESGDGFATAMSTVQLTELEDDDDSIWDVVITTVPGEDIGGVTDAGAAYLGVAPGLRAVTLDLPVRQKGTGIGMAPMRIYG